MAVILRYSANFDSFWGKLHQIGWSYIHVCDNNAGQRI